MTPRVPSLSLSLIVLDPLLTVGRTLDTPGRISTLNLASSYRKAGT